MSSAVLCTASCRSERWLLMSGGALKRRKAQGLYRSLKERARCEVPEEVADQISKDVPRTFIEPNLQPTNSRRREALRAVLLSFSLYDPTIGYVQGMHKVAGAALLPAVSADIEPSEADEERKLS